MVQVPLPGVPTYVVALISSSDKETADDILEQHQKILTLSQQSGLKVLSIGPMVQPVNYWHKTGSQSLPMRFSPSMTPIPMYVYRYR